MRKRIAHFSKNVFQESRPFRWVIRTAKKIIIPLMGGMPLYHLVKIFWRNLAKESVSHRGSSIAFNLFLSLLPALIFLFSLLPFIPIDDLNIQVRLFMATLMPASAYVTIDDTLSDILSRPRGSLLSFGLVASLYFASNGVFGMMEAFDRNDRRSFLKRRGIAIGLTISIGLLLILGIAIFVLSELAIDYLVTHSPLRDDLSRYAIALTKWVVIYILLLAGITLLFRHGDSRSERYKHIFPGAFMSSLLAVLTSILYAWYVDSFSDYNKLYGSLGTLIITMLWLYINSIMLIIGHEFNRSLIHTQMAIKRLQGFH